MNLYSLSLHQPTAIIKAIIGNFSGGKQQEIVVAKSKMLEILRPEDKYRYLSHYCLTQRQAHGPPL